MVSGSWPMAQGSWLMPQARGSRLLLVNLEKSSLGSKGRLPVHFTIKAWPEEHDYKNMDPGRGSKELAFKKLGVLGN